MKKFELGLKTGIALPLLGTLIIGLTLLFLFNYVNTMKEFKDREEVSIKTAVNTAKAFLEITALHYQQMAGFVANMPDVQEIVNKKDRNKLIDKFLPSFNYLKENFGVSQFHFHVPPAISLLRLHNLAQYGDDLSQTRKAVVYVETNKKGTKGIEIGVGGVGIRGIEPIFYKNNYVGSVDFGGGFEKELHIIKKAISGEVGVIFYKSALEGWSGLKDVKFNIGEFIPLYSTIQDIKPFIFESALKKASQNQETYYTDFVSQRGKDFFVAYIPLKDFSGKNIGFLYLIKERVLASSKVFTNLIINLLAYLAILILVALLIGYGMNKYVINPVVTLTKLADDISMGKTAEKVEVKDAKGEIAVLAKAIERMRITMKKLLE
ncbi:cache domain-containing protein [Thermodesulfovibrio hydrogeniphilus]